MDKEQTKKLVSLQKGELVGVQIYRQLAKVAHDSDLTKKLNTISEEEYTHSQILRKLTGADKKGNPLIGKLMGLMKGLMGMKKVLRMTAKGQYDTAKKYDQLVDQFPTLSVVAKQEKEHGNLLEKLANNL